MDVARAGAVDEPPVQPPRGLRPILGFSRLPPPARQVVRRALDQDDDFRHRVAVVAADQEESIGRAGWLFLVRPPGWESELEDLASAAAEASSAGAEAREERTAQRRLRGAEEAARRSEEQLAQTRAELAAANAAAGAERQGRRRAESERDELLQRVRSLERERDAAHRRAAAATNETARLSRELREHQEVLPAPVEAPAEPASPADVATPASAPPTAVPTAASSPPAPVVALEQVRVAVQEAAAAAAQLGAALGAAARALGPSAEEEQDPVPPVAPPTTGGRRRPSRPAELRLPLALPPGLLEDSREAADFLVRVPGMLVIVDGYNASLRRWPEHPISEQRQRLLQALAGLCARSGCDAHVIFDGTDDTSRALRAPRGAVRVTFSPAGVEADDLILELVDQAPAHRPLAVASDDRRVRREAAARGANGLSQEQLFAVAGLDT